MAGESLFVTGAGGTGKSFLVHAIVDTYLDMDRRCGVTALTGCAAVLLNKNAKTLHAWAGIKLGKENAEVLYERVIANRRALNRWRTTDLLIIDEVSMLLPELMRKLDIVGQRVRGSDKPFGGLQLLFLGDFCQLPPIHGMTATAGGRASTAARAWAPGTKSTEHVRLPFFAFEDPLWNILFGPSRTVQLTQNMRQRDDPAFQLALDELRMGKCSAPTQALLRTTMRPITTGPIKPTKLFATRADAERVNLNEMAALGDVTHYKFMAISNIPPTVPKTQYLYDAVDTFDKDAPYDPYLELAVGTQVMLVFNLDIDKGLVNGSRGVIVGFTDEKQYGSCVDERIVPVVQFLCCPDPIVIERQTWEMCHPDFPGVMRSQIPLRTAWALTIHKSQGATLDCASINIGTSVFEYGQAYVALSRVRSLAALEITELSVPGIRAHADVVAYYHTLQDPVSVPAE